MIPCIRLDKVTKAFNTNEVLRGVDLEIGRNESVVIIGRSGCGKSVLLKHLNALFQPDSGTVVVENQDLSGLKYEELVSVRKKIGMLFQSAALLDSLTVGENVGLALREVEGYSENVAREVVEEKLTLVGLGGTYDLYPANLSGGMRKRVGLARAIATSPEILLYDEPTTGLDPITADMINDLIIELHRRLKVTSIAVTHDMTSAYKIGERIVMLHDGKVEYDGTPDEIKNSGNAVVDQFINGRSTGPIQVR
nr:ABC transporter ATP-binding protein [candidate division Zixibacteria bacterium]